MTKKLTTSHEEVFRKFEKDPEFRKADRALKPYYDLMLLIIKRRKELGLTQNDLAERAATHQSRVSKIESAELDIRLSTLIQIAEALETEVVIDLVPFIDEGKTRHTFMTIANLPAVKGFDKDYDENPTDPILFTQVYANSYE